MNTHVCIQYGTLYCTRAVCCPGSSNCFGYVHNYIIPVYRLYTLICIQNTYKYYNSIPFFRGPNHP